MVGTVAPAPRTRPTPPDTRTHRDLATRSRLPLLARGRNRPTGHRPSCSRPTFFPITPRPRRQKPQPNCQLFTGPSLQPTLHAP
uniref:Uncharacterized protein n=1 Tax=Arundo donax TaxID=35708 RepID=A0A0A9F5C7_ARUDO